MNKWIQISIGDFVDFNPSETIKKGTVARKIAMDKLGVFQRKINGSEFLTYSAGPKFRNEDTLVAKITPCLENGKTAYVDNLKNDEVAFGSSEFIVLRKNESSDSKFIYYLARSPLFRQRAISCMEGTSGRKRVNEGALKRQEILVPSIKKQREIASVLSCLDDKIELNNKINVELEAMAKILYDYWFVQFDFPNEDGKPYKSSGGKMVYSEVLKREIPEGWEVKKLDDIADIKMGQSPAGESYNSDGNGMLFFQGSTDFGWRFPENRMYTSEPTRFAQEDDILLSVRAPVGTMNLAMRDCCIGRGLAALNSNEGYNSYIIYLMNEFKKKFEYLNGVGTTFGSLTKDNLYTLKLVYPERSILEKFNKKISTFDLKIKINAKENQKLAELRDWLLPMLMNGQVSVGDVAGESKLEVRKDDRYGDLFGEAITSHSINNPDLEIAILVYSLENGLEYNYGEVALQKAVYNASYLTANMFSKRYGFDRHYFGTFSKELKKDIQENPYLRTKQLSDGKEVYVVNETKIKEIKDVLSNQENEAFVHAIEDLIVLYNTSAISKKTEKMELFNTILKIYVDSKTTYIDIVYQAMKDWKVDKSGLKSKADRFSKEDTTVMLEFMLRRGVIK